MKGYSIFPKAPRLKPHHQMQFRDILRTLAVGGLTPLQKWNWHILKLQSTGWAVRSWLLNWPASKYFDYSLLYTKGLHYAEEWSVTPTPQHKPEEWIKMTIQIYSWVCLFFFFLCETKIISTKICSQLIFSMWNWHYLSGKTG